MTLFLSLVFPLLFHSIQDEIPEGSRALVTRLYQLWLLLAATLIMNFVAYLVLLISGATGAVGGFVTSIMYVGLLCNTLNKRFTDDFPKLRDFDHTPLILIVVSVRSFVVDTIPSIDSMPCRPVYNAYMKVRCPTRYNIASRRSTSVCRNKHFIIVRFISNAPHNRFSTG